MQELSKAYQQQIKQPFLSKPYELYCLLQVINQEAQEEADLQHDMLEYFVTNMNDIFLNEPIDKPYVTCEENYNRIDGSVFFPPKNEEVPYLYQGATGSILSDINCNINQSFYISFKNELTYEVKGICLHFAYGYPTQFAIEDKDGSVLYQYENNQAIFKTNDVFTFHKGLRIHILKMNTSYHRCRLSYIEFGMYVELTNENVTSMNYRQQIHPLSNDCYISDMSITCINQNGEFNTENPSSIINFLEKLQDMKVSLSFPLAKGKETIALASLYLNEWASNQKEVTFKAVDIFAFLGSTYYQTFETLQINAYMLFEEIFLRAGIESYKITPVLYDTKIENPLPKGTYKEILQLLCNATHCIFCQDRQGRVIVKPSTYEQKCLDIRKEDMLDVAIGTKLDQVKELEIIYTKYNQNEALEQINKGTYEIGEVFIEFKDPVAQVKVASGQAEIIASGPYFANIKVLQDGEIILEGYKLQESKQRCIYNLNERGVVKTIDNTLISSKQMAEEHWNWIKPYIISDRSYEASIRGRMELDVMDTIGFENEYNPNLMLQIEEYTLSFNGSLKGHIRGRKVVA